MKKFLAASIAALLICTGCGTEADPETTTPPPSITPTPTVSSAPLSPAAGGSIALSMRAPLTLNPLYNEDATVDTILRLVFEPLAIPDETLKPVANPALVKSIETSPDGMSILITLQSGANWSDGEPVTAKDIVFSVNTLREAPEGAVYKASAANIASVELAGDKAARLNLTQPFGAMAYMLMFPLIPEHHYKASGATEPAEVQKLTPVGNGAYTVEDYIVANAVTLAASENAAGGRPYIDEISVRIISDRESELNAFDQDIIQAVAPGLADWTRYLAAPDVRVSKYVTTCFEFVGFNFENETMQDTDVRRLVAQIAGDEAFLNGLYLDSAVRTVTPVSPASWLYSSDAASPAPNMTKALAALAGQTVRILVNEENTERVRVAEYLAEALAAEGVTGAKVLSVAFDVYNESVAAGEFDILVGGYNLALAPELSFLLHSENMGGTNIFRYQSETMDALLAAAFSATGDANLRRAMDELQKYIAEDVPCVGLVFRKSALLTDTNIHADPVPMEGDLLAGFANWFVETK